MMAIGYSICIWVERYAACAACVWFGALVLQTKLMAGPQFCTRLHTVASKPFSAPLASTSTFVLYDRLGPLFLFCAFFNHEFTRRSRYEAAQEKAPTPHERSIPTPL